MVCPGRLDPEQVPAPRHEVNPDFTPGLVREVFAHFIDLFFGGPDVPQQANQCINVPDSTDWADWKALLICADVDKPLIAAKGEVDQDVHEIRATEAVHLIGKMRECAPGSTNLQKVLTAVCKLDPDPAAAPAANVLAEVFDVGVAGADVPQQAEERGFAGATGPN